MPVRHLFGYATFLAGHMPLNEEALHVIVVGSGVGGLTAAAALAKRGRRVLVLERHFQLGGLMQTFSRREYTFATGLHYIGAVGGAKQAGRNRIVAANDAARRTDLRSA